MELDCSAAGFKAARFEHARLSQADAATVLGVNLKTLKRWEAGTARAPRAAVLALHLLGGDLGAIWPEWAGWRLDAPGKALVAPNGYRFDHGEMMALPYQYALVAELQRKAGRGASLPVDTGNVRPFPGVTRADAG